MSDYPIILRGTVRPDWIDYNGHMGDYAYAIVFSDAVTAFMDLIGIDADYRRSTLCTIYTLDMRIAYLKECHRDQTYFVSQQIIEADAKRYHGFFRMVDARSGEDLAWSEQLMMHMQQQPDGPPRALVFPPAVQLEVDRYAASQKDEPVPPWVGSRIGIRRKG